MQSTSSIGRTTAMGRGSYRQVDTADAEPATGVAGSDSGTLKKSDMSTMVTLQRLMALARPERPLMIFSGVAMACGSAISLAIPTYSGRVIDLSLVEAVEHDAGDASASTSSPSAMPLLLSLLGIMTLSGVAGLVRMIAQARAGHRLVARLRRHLYDGILSQDSALFDALPPGDLISRLSVDVGLVQSAVTDQALGLLRNAILLVGSVALLFATSTSLALVSVSVLPPIAVCAKVVGRQMRERQTQVRELQAVATSYAEQALTCIRTVQQFVAEPMESHQYATAVTQAHAQGIQTDQLRAVFSTAMTFVVNLALVGVLGYGGRLVHVGVLSPGDLASFVMYSILMGGTISGVSTQYMDLMKAVAAAQRVFDILDREPAIPPPCLPMVVNHDYDQDLQDSVKLRSFFGAGPFQATEQYPPLGTKGGLDDTVRSDIGDQSFLELMEFGGQDSNDEDAVESSHQSSTKSDNAVVVPRSVSFDNVTFAYPSRPDSQVLNGFNLVIPAGQSVALVGGSGAGKSTIASLLTRLYDPQSGDIRLDDDNLVREMTPQDLRRQVGIVVQEPLLFPTTIEANIRYGSPQATKEQVQEAARLAFVWEFAKGFPDGLQTLVGPRGTQLSGGQKQRVAVARCILKNPPIVIFDEATSALDAESESNVQQAIDTACQGRTVIQIAHRLSTIRHVDTIAVLKGGQVVERGSFDELVQKPDGPFRQLMEKQLLQ